jgi:hypothetical protein
MLNKLDGCGELFHTAAGTAFADLLIDGHRETWAIRGKRFRAWLRHRIYRETGAAPSAEAIRSALDLLEARAEFEGPERAVHVRIAEHDDHIYLDLADEHWRAVEVGRDGWRVVVAPPVRFRRAGGLLPIPAPERGGSIEILASFLNLPKRDDFVLVVAWLLAALRARGPYPLLAVSGEQGSAKTVLAKLLKAMIDPNVAPVRTLARDERELMIAANNGHLLAVDNLSNLPIRMSDALCRLASGGSFAVRRLYSDSDEVLFQAARPILLNGIEEVINRPDLADRAIFLSLPPIEESQRRPETELWRKFEYARPAILGALLDAMVVGLRELPAVHLPRLPRMADFALWATACEAASWPSGTFSRAYETNRRAAVESVIDADPVAVCVRDIMAKQSAWIGTAADLLRAGLERGSDGWKNGAGWPKTPRALAGRLRRAQTFLRALGIEVTFGREGRAGMRTIRITTRECTVRTTADNISGFEPGAPSPVPPSVVGRHKGAEYASATTAD